MLWKQGINDGLCSVSSRGTFAAVLASVIFGKELDEKEKQAIAKEKIESKKKKRKLLEKPRRTEPLIKSPW